jgi:hypothetical protein
MATKEDLHKMKFTPLMVPKATTDTASLLHTLALDTKGYESNMLIVTLGAVTDCDYVMRLYESDVSAADVAGATCTVCDHSDVIVAVSDNDATVLAKIPDTTKVATLTVTADSSRSFMFAYIGDKRWIRVHSTTAGSKAGFMSVMGVQGHFRYQGRAGIHAGK